MQQELEWYPLDGDMAYALIQVLNFLYSGRTAGPLSTHTGGGSNPQRLPIRRSHVSDISEN